MSLIHTLYLIKSRKEQLLNMKKRAIALMLCIAALLCGCNSSGNNKNGENDSNVNDTYFDISQLESNIEKTVLDVNFTDFKYDDQSRVFLTFDTYTLTPSYFLINMRDHKIWVDLSTGRVQSVCDIPGCDHSINTKGCLEHENGTIQHVKGASDGVFFKPNGYPGKLFFKDDSEKRTVFENDFFTEYEEKTIPDYKTSFSCFMRDDIMYVIGRVYMYMVDMKTMTKIGEPYILSTSPIWDSDVSNGFFWITNENLELICRNTKNGEVTKVDDKVFRLRCSGGMLYYSRLLAERSENTYY